MSAYLVDMTGRGKNGTYDTLGKAYKVDDLQHELRPYQQLDYPLVIGIALANK